MTVFILKMGLQHNFSLNTQELLVQRKKLVSKGVDSLLAIFQKVGQQRLFPRTIMTKGLGKQKKIFNNYYVLV